MKPLASLRIVEIAGSHAGAYAGKLFADYGAEVLRIEPPGGDPQRRVPPLWKGMGTTFAFLNTSKTAAILDGDVRSDREALIALVAAADVVLESSAPDPLVPLTREWDLPTTVRTYISPLGLTGAASNRRPPLPFRVHAQFTLQIPSTLQLIAQQAN